MITSVKEILISVYLYDSHHKASVGLSVVLVHRSGIWFIDGKMMSGCCSEYRLLSGSMTSLRWSVGSMVQSINDITAGEDFFGTDDPCS